MRTLILTVLSCNIIFFARAQPAFIDSLNYSLQNTKNDTIRLVLFSRLGDAHLEVNIDSAVYYARRYLELSQNLGYKLNEVDALQQMSEYLVEQASSGIALELSFKALQLLKDIKGEKKMLPPRYLEMLHVPSSFYSYPQYQIYIEGKVNNMIAMIYSMNNNPKGLPYLQEALNIATTHRAEDLLTVTYSVFSLYAKPDSALLFLKKGHQLAVKTGNKKLIPQLSGGIAMRYHEIGDHIAELDLLRTTIEFCVQEKRFLRVGYGFLVLSDYFSRETDKKDSALFFAKRSLQVAREVRSPYLELYASHALAELYKKENKNDSAVKYLEMKEALQERTSGEEKIRQLANADFVHQQQQATIEATKKQFRNELKMYGLLVGFVALVLLTLMMWRNNNNRRRAFGLLQEQKEQTDQALQELKSTQTQLIQKEKMASLGELTAGIAHEIQNPLNFVNNFSEVNAELIVELREQQKKEIRDNRIEDDLLNSIKENEEKINYHGKRADAIVKGMLQHSRSTTGQRESTDINAMVEEYVKLAFHGYRGKDSSFDAKLSTEFDPNIGEIEIAPHEIGRVLLNILNNAFYAVKEKQKAVFGRDAMHGVSTTTPEVYQPQVSVTTNKKGNQVEITVKDNGTGIPEKIVDKLFQPFFTTKPSGQGTGLGLSLSYDIIKAHGGELKVNSTVGQGSEFQITLNKGA